ncbi:hypothetical protein BGZ76_007793 [Entomortierella beljakovae]|nr:hypothetical protein BGZ76_007793 [Entomortierella beljakovae]
MHNFPVHVECDIINKRGYKLSCSNFKKPYELASQVQHEYWRFIAAGGAATPDFFYILNSEDRYLSRTPDGAIEFCDADDKDNKIRWKITETNNPRPNSEPIYTFNIDDYYLECSDTGSSAVMSKCVSDSTFWRVSTQTHDVSNSIKPSVLKISCYLVFGIVVSMMVTTFTQYNSDNEDITSGSENDKIVTPKMLVGAGIAIIGKAALKSIMEGLDANEASEYFANLLKLLFASVTTDFTCHLQRIIPSNQETIVDVTANPTAIIEAPTIPVINAPPPTIVYPPPTLDTKPIAFESCADTRKTINITLATEKLSALSGGKRVKPTLSVSLGTDSVTISATTTATNSPISTCPPMGFPTDITATERTTSLCCMTVQGDIHTSNLQVNLVVGQ